MTARLTRLLGDFDLAEDLVQEAIVSALEHWPRDGIPEAPAAWLLTVAKRKGLDRLRRATRYRDKLALLEEEAGRATVDPTDVRSGVMAMTDTDDRLELIFTCCHPALSREAQVARTRTAHAGTGRRSLVRSSLLELAGAMRRPGPYQLQAAIAAVHAEAAAWDDTDWPQILRLYDALLAASAGFAGRPPQPSHRPPPGRRPGARATRGG